MTYGRTAGRARPRSAHSWLLRIAIAGCLAACLVASPARAARTWSRPMDVSGVVKLGEEPLQLAVDSQGNATAVWHSLRGGSVIVESAVRRVGRRWSAPFRLFDDATNPFASLQIAVDPLGNATAVWERHEGRSFVVQSATRPVGRSWSAPVTLSKAGAGSAVVAVNPVGEATAVWLLERDGGNRSVVQSATRPAGGSWSAPVDLSPMRQDASFPQLVLDPQGDATAIWEEEQSGAIRSATRPPGGSWSAPVALTAVGETAHFPQLTFDAQGNAIAVWQGYAPRGSVIRSATRPAGGSWSAPVRLSEPRRFAQDAQIAVDPRGDATAIWARSNGRNLVIQGAMRPAGGSWSAPVDISAGDGQGGEHPRLVVDSLGDATAVWKGYDRKRGTFAIQGATRSPAGRWSRPVDISRRAGDVSEPQIAIDPQGTSTVIWAIGARGGGIVQAATSPMR